MLTPISSLPSLGSGFPYPFWFMGVGGALPPGGTCNGGGPYGGGLISVSKSIRFRFEDSCKTGFGRLFFSASSGGVGVSITRAYTLGESGSLWTKGFNHLGGSSIRSCQTITYGTWLGWLQGSRAITFSFTTRIIEGWKVPSGGHPTWKVGHSAEQKVINLLFVTSSDRSYVLALISEKWSVMRESGVDSPCPIARVRRRSLRITTKKSYREWWQPGGWACAMLRGTIWVP